MKMDCHQVIVISPTALLFQAAAQAAYLRRTGLHLDAQRDEFDASDKESREEIRCAD